MTDTYKIVRFFQRDSSRRQIIKRGLTLEEAQAHCNQTETSSTTAVSVQARRLTQQAGPWFDGYEKE